MTQYIYDYKAGVSNVQRAREDLVVAWRQRKLWTDMAVRGFRDRYKGAFFGPFWLTFTTGLAATGLGVLYGVLFDVPIKTHLPYVTVAWVVWEMIGGFITGGCNVFLGNAKYFNEFPMPYSLFSFRLILTQAFTMCFRLIVLVAIVVVLSVPITPMAILSFFGFVLIFWIGFWSSLGLGVLNARFRDFGQLAAAALRAIFFVTPIFWVPSRLGEYAYIVDFNPFYHIINVVRAPILQLEGIGLSFAVVIALAVITPAVSILLFGKFSHRLAYWCS